MPGIKNKILYYEKNSIWGGSLSIYIGKAPPLPPPDTDDAVIEGTRKILDATRQVMTEAPSVAAQSDAKSTRH